MDVQIARQHALGRLQVSFGDRFSQETIAGYLEQAFDEFAGDATVEQWVPVLAERYVTQQLTALAKVEGHEDQRPVVLFLDAHDAGRSQLARALFERHAAGRAHSWSGGFSPSHSIDRRVSEMLEPMGIDLIREFPKPVTAEIVEGADVIVVLGRIPIDLPAAKHRLDWTLPELDSLRGEELAELRDDLDARTAALAAELADRSGNSS